MRICAAQCCCQRISSASSSNGTAPAGSATSNMIALHLGPALNCRSKCGIRSRSALKCTVRGLRWPSAQIIHAKHGSVRFCMQYSRFWRKHLSENRTSVPANKSNVRHAWTREEIRQIYRQPLPISCSKRSNCIGNSMTRGASNSAACSRLRRADVRKIAPTARRARITRQRWPVEDCSQ